MKNVLLILSIVIVTILSSCSNGPTQGVRYLRTDGSIFVNDDESIAGLRKGDTTTFNDGSKIIVDSLIADMGYKKDTITYKDIDTSAFSRGEYVEIKNSNGYKVGDHIKYQAGEIAVIKRIAYQK